MVFHIGKLFNNLKPTDFLITCLKSSLLEPGHQIEVKDVTRCAVYQPNLHVGTKLIIGQISRPRGRWARLQDPHRHLV